MNLSLKQLTQILEKVGVFSSLEEEILTAAESLFTPPEANKESTYEEPCMFNEESLGVQEGEEDKMDLQHDLSKTSYTYESLIERWFQASTRLDSFRFSFSFFNFRFQPLISNIYTYSRLSIAKLKNNIFFITVVCMATLVV